MDQADRGQAAAMYVEREETHGTKRGEPIGRSEQAEQRQYAHGASPQSQTAQRPRSVPAGSPSVGIGDQRVPA